MSSENQEWLNTMTRIGFCAKRGAAWHGRMSNANHFDDAVPMEEVYKLLDWDVKEISLGDLVVPASIDPDGTLQSLNWGGRKGIYRPETGDVFEIFKENYTPHNYRQTLVDDLSLILDSGLEVGSVGLL